MFEITLRSFSYLEIEIPLKTTKKTTSQRLYDFISLTGTGPILVDKRLENDKKDKYM